MAKAEGPCLICDEIPHKQCCRLSGCTHLVCMECAMKIATFGELVRCPVCRADFDTITDYSGNFTMDLKTNTLFRRGEDKTMVPYIVLNEMEVSLASRIRMIEELNENEEICANFYMPQFIDGILQNREAVLATNDADDGYFERVMTRSDYAQFWYDKDIYKKLVVDTVAKLQNVFGKGITFPLFVLKALVSKAFMEMVDMGKLVLREVKWFPGDPTDWYHLIITMPYPASEMTRIAVFEAAVASQGVSVV